MSNENKELVYEVGVGGPGEIVRLWQDKNPVMADFDTSILSRITVYDQTGSADGD